METALYLIPVTLGDTAIESVLPSYNKEVILNIRHFIVAVSYTHLTLPTN